MEKNLVMLKELFNLPVEQQMFLIAISTIAVTAFALYVVLVIVKTTKSKGGC